MDFKKFGKLKIVFISIFSLILISELRAQKVEIGKTFKGSASYYHKKFTGRKTASGERLNNVDFTCAHKYLPFGTMIEVENPVTHRWVVVRVNDRGPFSKGRVVDLSYSAAKEIGMIQKGIIRVNCKVVGKNGEILLAREGATEENFREIFQQNEADSVKIPMLPESAKKKN